MHMLVFKLSLGNIKFYKKTKRFEIYLQTTVGMHATRKRHIVAHRNAANYKINKERVSFSVNDILFLSGGSGLVLSCL